MASMHKKSTDRRTWSPRDGILILSLLAVALVAYLWQGLPQQGGVCQVIYQGEVVLTVPLDVDQVFSIEQLPQVVFQVRGGRVAFIESDCPDQTCVHTGWIGSARGFAACVPNRVALRILGAPQDDAPDAVI